MTRLDRILSWPQVKRVVCLSRATVYRCEARGTFPRRQRLTGQRIGWRASEIQRWIEGARDWQRAQ